MYRRLKLLQMSSAAGRCFNTKGKAFVESDYAMVTNRVEYTDEKHGRLCGYIVLATCQQLRECSFLKISIRRNKRGG
jgi:hypothetical protein